MTLQELLPDPRNESPDKVVREEGRGTVNCSQITQWSVIAVFKRNLEITVCHNFRYHMI